MIYNKGTVDVTASSPVVTGTGTKWSKRVHAGDLFEVAGSTAHYQVARVVSDTELRLAEDMPASASGVSYSITSDFSHYYSIPYPRSHDIEKASILKRSTKKIDSLLQAMDDRVFAIEYPVGSVVDIISTPSIGTVYITPPSGIVLTADSDVTADSGDATADGLYIAPAPTGAITADSAFTADAGDITADGLYTG